ncbi:hypothetical protein J6590_087777 [Homalodisca vitripennis]|nr:hypothetical protein J6590_087777 [Homalodisca vitripennis]
MRNIQYITSATRYLLSHVISSNTLSPLTRYLISQVVSSHKLSPPTSYLVSHVISSHTLSHLTSYLLPQVISSHTLSPLTRYLISHVISSHTLSPPTSYLVSHAIASLDIRQCQPQPTLTGEAGTELAIASLDIRPCQPQPTVTGEAGTELDFPYSKKTRLRLLAKILSKGSRREASPPSQPHHLEHPVTPGARISVNSQIIVIREQNNGRYIKSDRSCFPEKKHRRRISSKINLKRFRHQRHLEYKMYCTMHNVVHYAVLDTSSSRVFYTSRNYGQKGRLNVNVGFISSYFAPLGRNSFIALLETKLSDSLSGTYQHISSGYSGYLEIIDSRYVKRSYYLDVRPLSDPMFAIQVLPLGRKVNWSNYSKFIMFKRITHLRWEGVGRFNVKSVKSSGAATGEEGVGRFNVKSVKSSGAATGRKVNWSNYSKFIMFKRITHLRWEGVGRFNVKSVKSSGAATGRKVNWSNYSKFIMFKRITHLRWEGVGRFNVKSVKSSGAATGRKMKKYFKTYSVERTACVVEYDILQTHPQNYMMTCSTYAPIKTFALTRCKLSP